MPFHKLFQLLRGSRPVPPPAAAEEAAPAPAMAPETRALAGRIDRLDLQAAVILHLEWCVAFNDHLSHINQGESLPVRGLPGAEQSELGQWLQRSGSRATGEHPAFAELLREHQHLHELADEALKLATEDRMDLASTLLNTDFERSRARVMALLREMQKG